MGMAELNAVRRNFELFAAGRDDAVTDDLPVDIEFRDHVIPEAPGATDRDGMEVRFEIFAGLAEALAAAAEG